jgi:hypothetical protein
MLFTDIVKDEDLSLYFPDYKEKSKLTEWSFFFAVINTKQPEYLKSIIDHARALRFKPEEDPENMDVILLTNEWHSKLMEDPYISRMICALTIFIGSKGRAIHLLKASTKQGKTQ